MYQPAYHREDRLDVQHTLIENHPIGLLISKGPDGSIEANSLSFFLDRHQGQSGVLKAYMAGTNTQWQILDGQPVLVVFQGTLSYVTPAFYETKTQTGKVVPTWNYVMVQVRGIAEVRKHACWQLEQNNDRTTREKPGYSHSTAASDAPETKIRSQACCIEISIEEIAGKWKVSQDEHYVDQRSAAEGFAPDNPEMAALIRSYCQL